MKKTNYDVLVIGAGPAGSIASSILHKAGLNIRVVEKEQFPRFVIGESLLPRCMEALEEADLLDAVKAQGFQEKFGAKFIRDNDVADFNFSDQYTNGWNWTWQVQRSKFDLALIQEVEKRGVPVSFKSTVTKIDFNQSGESVTMVKHDDGSEEEISARFIVDASGYGRVIPRLFNLDKPSVLEPRRAVFAHVTDARRNNFDEPNRIIVIIYAPRTWVWIIPFSDGTTSLGFVGDFDFFDRLPGDLTAHFESLIAGNEYLKNRFGDCTRIFETRKLEAWSATTDKFYGNGFVLTGNVTEFLDPIFSSGVMFATVSSQLASNLVVRKFRGEEIDWDNDYTSVIRQGVDTFKSYVMGWYDGTLEKIFFTKEENKVIKRQICSVLAGYVWDTSNPFVREHRKAPARLASFLDQTLKTDS